MPNPKIIDVNTLLALGIDPKTGLPLKMGNDITTKSDIKHALRIIDEQSASNRYVWKNIPCNLSSQEIERLIYYKGQLAFFYCKDDGKFYFMPYALDGTGSIDFYGRAKMIHPIPLSFGTGEEENKLQQAYLNTVKLNVVYGIVLPDELTYEMLDNSAVLLHDYTKQQSQYITPRQLVNDPILDCMAECVPYMQTALMLSTGIKGVRVSDADQADSVKVANYSIKKAALQQQGYVPIEGAIEFQELTSGTVGQAEDFMLAMQSLDNLRLSTYGIDSGGLFEKKAHETNLENSINGGPVGLVLQDGLSIRKHFCHIVNSIWEIGLDVEISETIIGRDITGDGLAYDRDEDGGSTGMNDEGGTDDGNDASI